MADAPLRPFRLSRANVLRLELHHLDYGGVVNLAGETDPISMNDFEDGEAVVGIKEDGNPHIFYYKMEDFRGIVQNWKDRIRNRVGPARNPSTNRDLYNRDGRDLSEMSLYLAVVPPRSPPRLPAPPRSPPRSPGSRRKRPRRSPPPPGTDVHDLSVGGRRNQSRRR